MKYTAQQIATSREYLLDPATYGLAPGATVWTKVEHVSRSGMSRVISCYVIKDDTPVNISAHVGYVLGMPIDRDRLGVKVGGCGMDMGFAVVYELSHALWATGFGCIGQKCPSNAHSNGDRDHTPHGICADCREATHKPTPGHEYEHWHSDGGYALRQRWL